MDAPPVARTRKLGPAFDLIARYRGPSDFFFERAGLGVVGAGDAIRVPVPAGPGQAARAAEAAAEALGRIPAQDDRPPPVAVGALPFDEGSPAMLVVPALAVRRTTPGETWEVLLGTGGGPSPRAERWTGRAAPHEAFAEIHLRPVPSPADYAEAVARAVRRIRSGRLRKVVVARTIEVHAERELDPKRLLWRLRAVDPDCHAFAVPAGDGGALVGASPELLVRRSGREVRAIPLAGSAPRSGDPREDRMSAERLLSSAKDREEHAAVADAVDQALRPLCADLERDAEPVTLGTANVWHLATRFRGRLLEPIPSALELVAALHPTPAVCGTPREAARRAIADLEPFDRGLYAGPVGWVDANGDGEWAIALRCAEIAGRTARLFAGAGIVAGSVPEMEVDETERKFRAFLDSLRWG